MGMSEGIKARIETNDGEEATRVDSGGEVSADGATFRFSIGETGSDSDGWERKHSDEKRESESESDIAGAEGEVNTDDPRYLAPLAAVPTDRTIRCEALGGRRAVEFILRQREGSAVAWRNSCPHEPDVRLDPGWGAMVRDDQIVCHEHGARFEGGDGLCTYGPCRGKVLDPVGVEIRNDAVYLTDERFEAGRRV
jgi:nitrite reductase/ring-hydroxylating ferredoxin subunit